MVKYLASLAALPLFTFASLSFSASQETIVQEDSLAASIFDCESDPEDLDLTIFGTVELGRNPCLAQGVIAKFEQRQHGDQIIIVPTLSFPDDFPRRTCIAEYAPVTAYIQLQVSSGLPTISDVIIVHVGAMGRKFSARTMRPLAEE